MYLKYDEPRWIRRLKVVYLRWRHRRAETLHTIIGDRLDRYMKIPRGG